MIRTLTSWEDSPSWSKNDPFLDVNIELEAIDAVQLQAITPARNSIVKVDMDNVTRRE